MVYYDRCFKKNYDVEKKIFSKESIKKVKEILKKLGYSTGLFHKYIFEKKGQHLTTYKGIKSFSHGDFHGGNIFYDEKTFYVIDTESASENIANADMSLDELVRNGEHPRKARRKYDIRPHVLILLIRFIKMKKRFLS